MAASKRKRGGQESVQLNAKKGKFVVDDIKTQTEGEQKTNNQVTIPAPVSKVSFSDCSQL